MHLYSGAAADPHCYGSILLLIHSVIHDPILLSTVLLVQMAHVESVSSSTFNSPLPLVFDGESRNPDSLDTQLHLQEVRVSMGPGSNRHCPCDWWSTPRPSSGGEEHCAPARPIARDSISPQPNLHYIAICDKLHICHPGWAHSSAAYD